MPASSRCTAEPSTYAPRPGYDAGPGPGSGYGAAPGGYGAATGAGAAADPYGRTQQQPAPGGYGAAAGGYSNPQYGAVVAGDPRLAPAAGAVAVAVPAAVPAAAGAGGGQAMASPPVYVLGPDGTYKPAQVQYLYGPNGNIIGQVGTAGEPVPRAACWVATEGASLCLCCACAHACCIAHTRTLVVRI